MKGGVHQGKVTAINGNLVTAEFEQPVTQNEVTYVRLGELRLKSELIRIRGRFAEMQVFEDTTGLKAGDAVEFTGELLSAELGPGLLGQVYDGLQNPLPQLAAQCGNFLQRGTYLLPLDRARTWTFTPTCRPGATLFAGDSVGTVPEGIFTHRIMVPFGLPAVLAYGLRLQLAARQAARTEAKGRERLAQHLDALLAEFDRLAGGAR